MKIDRHNYEEFFLLYIDNELTIEQKKEVELFVQENPDLEEELLMFRQSKLSPDNTVIFEGKDSLLKGTSSIHLDNYEPWLLLYADNELNAEEKLKVEKFAAQNPSVQKELELFLQAKLQPEEIIFADKKSLYRKEEKVRIITMQWWKITTVAAIFILGAGFGIYSLTNQTDRTSIKNSEVSATGNTSVDNKSTANINQLPTQKKEQDNNRNMLGVNSANNKKENKSEKQPAINDQKPVNALVVSNKVQLPLQNDKAHPQLANLKLQPETSVPQIKNSLAFNDKQPQQIVNNSSVTTQAVQTPDKVEAPQNTGAEYASNTENTENKKLRGFFRKATRFIQHRTNFNAANDDDKVLIGGVAVNLK